LSFPLQAQKLPSADPDFNIPLRFDVIGDGVKILPMSLQWEINSQDQLKIGEVVFDPKSFSLGIFQLGRLDRRLEALFENSSEREEWVLLGRWPFGVFQEGGIIEAYSKSGRVLWSREFNRSDLKNWQDQLKDWKEKFLRKIKKTSSNSARDLEGLPLWSTNFGLRSFRQEKSPFFNLEEPFRLCVSQETEDGFHTKLCTRLLETQKLPQNKMRNMSGGIRLAPVERLPEPPRVIAFGESQPLQGQREVRPGVPVQFFAQNSVGMSFEFLAKPTRFNLVEMVKQPNGLAKVTAWGSKPNAKVIDLPRNSTFLERLVGPPFYQSAGDLREFWEFEFDPSKPHIDMSGQGGGLFSFNFEISKLPTENQRLYLRSDTLDDTYVDGTKLIVKSKKNLRVSSKMKSLEEDDSNKQTYVWRFSAPQSGQMNRSYIFVEEGSETHRAYRELYRGYPGDVTVRASLIAGSNGNLIYLGEGSFNYWFESLGGWNNSLLSRDRWGVQATYFQSLVPLTFGSRSDTLSNTDADLRYRFTPGLWSRDDTWGMEFATSYVSYSLWQTELYGGGIFWNRSFPRALDDLLNLVPLLRKPKFFELQLDYFPVSSAPDVTPNNFGSGLGNWHLNFRGKILWTKTFYMDATAGIKQFDLRKNVNSSTVKKLDFQLTAFFGSIGMGFEF
jgi:hypothetical protein